MGRWAWVAVACTAVLLLVAAAGRSYCDGSGTGKRGCQTAIELSYGVRGLGTGSFPFVDARIGSDYQRVKALQTSGEQIDGFSSAPVLNGVVEGAVASLAGSAATYARIASVLLAIAALATAFMLGRLVEQRALVWAASPLLAVAAMGWWDTLGIALSVSSLVLWQQGRDRWAAGLAGLAATFAWLALLLVPCIVLASAARGGIRRAAASLGIALGVIAVPNVVVAALNFDGWAAALVFHWSRLPEASTVWSFLPREIPITTLNMVHLVIGLVAGGLVLARAWQLRTRRGYVPAPEAFGALVALALLLGRSVGTYHLLWLLVAIALVRTSISSMALVTLAGLMMFWAQSIVGMPQGIPIMQIAAVVLGLMQLLLVYEFLTARSAYPPPAGAAVTPIDTPAGQPEGSLAT